MFWLITVEKSFTKLVELNTFYYQYLFIYLIGHKEVKMAILLRLVLASLFVKCIMVQKTVQGRKLMIRSFFPEKIQRPLPVLEARERSGDDQCPLAVLIAPCECAPFDPIDIICSDVTSEQLAAVFQDFPVSEIGNLYIHDSPLLTSLEFDLNGVTLNYLNVGHSGVATVAADFLEGSHETLQIISIWYSELTNEGFPFSSLANYSNLEQLDLTGNHMDTMPIISSLSLRYLNIVETRISEILPGKRKCKVIYSVVY